MVTAGCWKAKMRKEPQEAAGKALPCPSVLTALGLLCKNTSMRFVWWALGSLEEVPFPLLPHVLICLLLQTPPDWRGTE